MNTFLRLGLRRAAKRTPPRSTGGRQGVAAFVRDRRGATIIEFAIVAAPFIALLIAILETSTVFFAQQTLETAAERSSRQLMTGEVQAKKLTAADFRKVACKNLANFMSCDRLFVDVRNAQKFSSLDVTAPTLNFDSKGNITNTWKFDPGGVGDVVIMRMMYLWPVQPGPLGFDLSNIQGNRRLLVATSVFKTEPYACTSNVCN